MHHNFGFKVVDKAPATLAPILDYALANGRPLEVGLYFEEADALAILEERLAGAAIPINAHSNHLRCHAFNLANTLEILKEHIQQASALGSRYSILHVAGGPMTERETNRPAVLCRLLDNLERAEEACAAADYRLHLENVYHSLPFYRELFAGIRGRGLKRIHFCFDIGHAKIWSVDTLDQWMNFMGELEREGFALHCHLHANQGIADEHLALQEVEALKIEGPDGFYNDYGYPQAYWELERRFPVAVKVFEVKAELALGNYQAVSAAGVVAA